jgi:hypothetical protein
MANKPLPKLGTVNGACLAKLYKGSFIVGTCMDTTNAIAYGFAKTGADTARSLLGTWYLKDQDENRIANAGWLTSDEQAGFTALKPTKAKELE